MLALLEHQNEKLLRRQARMFGSEIPLSARWMQACDFLEEDLASGYVRVLQEIISAGYADAELASAARKALMGWFDLLSAIAAEARDRFGSLGPFTDAEIASLVGLVFMGAESMILLGMDQPIRSALRGIGQAIERLEANAR
jgi:hypothetical protein